MTDQHGAVDAGSVPACFAPCELVAKYVALYAVRCCSDHALGIDSFLPTRAPQSQGTLINIVGVGMAQSADDLLSVTIAGIDCFSFEFIEPTLITCVTVCLCCFFRWLATHAAARVGSIADGDQRASHCDEFQRNAHLDRTIYL